MSKKQSKISFGAPEKSKDPTWEHCEKVEPGNRLFLKCSYCGKSYHGGVYRIKHHLAQTKNNVGACKEVPDEVKQFFVSLIKKFENSKEKCDAMVDIDDGDGLGNAAGKLMEGASKTTNTMNTMYKKPDRDKTCMAICDFLYANAIPFHVVNSMYFKGMVKAIGDFGKGLKPPSAYEARVTNLKKKVEYVQGTLAEFKEEWKKTGCSLMSDGWTDKKGRSITNFLVNSPRGTVFLKSIDTSDIQHSAENLFALLDDVVVELGEDNVVQVITDGALAYVKAGEMLMEKRKHLYWSPCAAHCINLILEDIGSLPMHHDVVEKAKLVSVYIYKRVWVLNLMRKYTNGRDLTRAGATRFATNYLNLKSFHVLKVALRKMFTSEAWTKSNYAKEQLGSKVQGIILSDDNFWPSIISSLKSVIPIVKVLRLVDGDDKPAMGYIYKAIDKAKEQIQANFKNVKRRYEVYMKIIEVRWNTQLHGPLHAAGYYLNPRYHYSPDFGCNFDIKNGLYDAIKRMCPSREERIEIDKQLDLFTSAGGMFGHEMAVDTRNRKHPALWWKSYGDSAPQLQRVAVRILSATCSATGCERNWSIFEQVHTKRRNRLSQQRMSALVYVKYNLQLEERFTKRKAQGDSYDPICLSDLESDDEWITEKEDVVAQGDPTWMDVYDCFQLTEAEEIKKKRKRGPRNLSTMKLAQGKGDINRQRETRLVEENEIEEVEVDEIEDVEEDFERSETQIQAESDDNDEWLFDDGCDLGD